MGLIKLSFYDDPIRIIIAISPILVNNNSLTTRVNRDCRLTDQSLTAVLVRMVVTEDNVERFGGAANENLFSYEISQLAVTTIGPRWVVEQW